MNCKMKCWKIAILVVVGIAALGWVVMALWNWLLPELFGIREIGYVQAMGVLLLSKILFGGFRGHCGGHARWHQHRLENMTPEEREKFKSGMSGCCGGKQKADETGE
ncbi:MAG: hypothetical protein HZB47_09760 [Nitrosomonadales bacterium]|nr:hypothetical protein [Nitrosomonadales bacterium]